jgi:hypothetical protein
VQRRARLGLELRQHHRRRHRTVTPPATATAAAAATTTTTTPTTAAAATTTTTAAANTTTTATASGSCCRRRRRRRRRSSRSSSSVERCEVVARHLAVFERFLLQRQRLGAQHPPRPRVAPQHRLQRVAISCARANKCRNKRETKTSSRG